MQFIAGDYNVDVNGSRKSAESGAGRLPLPQAYGTHTHTHTHDKVAFTQCQTLSNKCTKWGRWVDHKDRGRAGKVTAKHTHTMCVFVCVLRVCVWVKCNSCYRLAAVGRKKAQKVLHVAHSQQQRRLASRFLSSGFVLARRRRLPCWDSSHAYKC